ncbi:MAG: family peptidase [Cyanobacteria bacterium RYN_339]|nr:family peptidase [Cyanobacteria bacterium RYN_339]
MKRLILLSALILAPTVAAPVLARPPAPVAEDRRVANMVAFTRLVGYVRYFHPSDQAFHEDWDRFTVRGMAAVEDAPDAAALAERLAAIFKAVAPTVQVYRAGKVPDLPVALARPKSAVGVSVVSWRHHGLSFGVAVDPKVYESNRERVPLDDKAPKPADVYRADLGGGVACAVPTALFANEEGTLPLGEKPPTGKAVTYAAIATEWNVLQHFYPYWDVVNEDWNKDLSMAFREALRARTATAESESVQRLLAHSRDGHGYFSSTKEPRAFRLPILWRWVEHQLVVTAVAPEAAATVKVGDVVTKLSGRAVAEAMALEMDLVDGATPHWRRVRALQELSRGDQNASLALELNGKKAVTLKCSLPRAADTLREDRPARLAELKPGLWYVDLDRVTDKEFEAAVPKLALAKGIVFDLRGYPSHIKWDTVFAHLSDQVLKAPIFRSPVYTKPDQKAATFEEGGWTIQPRAPRFKAKLAFLGGEATISQAELWLSIVKGHKLGEVVGSPTAGSDGNIVFQNLPGGYRVGWTGMVVLNHDRSRQHGIGILPTVPAAATVAGIKAGKDEVLEKGLEVVSK